MKFSLGGYKGLDIFAPGSPWSARSTCDFGAEDAIEEVGSAGESSLKYDSATDTYTYVWKTDKAWAGTCRVLRVMLDDGTVHVAGFKLK